MPRTRYAELVGKMVIDGDGRAVGRVADVIAERRGESLCVTGLLVGPGALLRRIAFRRWPFGDAPLAQFVPWERIERIERRIYLHLAERPTMGRGDGER